MMTKTKADKYPQRVRNELRFRELTVLRVERAGAAFQRIVLGGEALEGFASHGFDDHTVFFFPIRRGITPPQADRGGIDWGKARVAPPATIRRCTMPNVTSWLTISISTMAVSPAVGRWKQKWAISW